MRIDHNSFKIDTGNEDSRYYVKRGDENYINIDLHILVDPDTKTLEAHEVAHTVEKAIKKEFPSIKDVVIHIEPYEGKA